MIPLSYPRNPFILGILQILSNRDSEQYEELTRRIIGCAMRVHSALGPGFLESAYQNALTHELGKSGIRHERERERKIQVIYDGEVVGDFIADMFVEQVVIDESCPKPMRH